MGPYDCIHSHVHRFSGYILTLARLAGVPVRVAHSHTADKESDNRHFYPFVMSILMDIGATAGLGVSEKATRALFGENWKVDPRWRVSHLGIDLEPFCCPVDSRSIRAEFGIPEHAIVVGHVGGFVPMKNHSFILEVAQQVCAANPEALFVFVGDGPLRKAMEIKAENLGIARHTRFIGVRNDVVRILKGLIDLFLFPSLYEGFPVALMEAQAAGLRCFVADTISTEIDICPELITRLSLADGAYRWAESILKAQCVVQPTFHPDRMHYFSIEVAARRLCSVYDQQ
jgi:glycosyltransferase involved in cell wall biosynthesis